MNSALVFLGIESWKPVLTALAMPPVPFIFLMLVGARTILWRRGIGWLVVLLAAAGLWLTSTTAFAEWFTQAALRPAPALSSEVIAELRKTVAARKAPVAIVVLGGGREARAPEYGVSNLTGASLERLRYGLWLARETGAPVAFSGGVGRAQINEGPSEAEIAARIAEQEFNRPLRWVESRSQDTLQNAAYTLPVMRQAGIKRVILVTHGYHMRRSLRAFEDAAQGQVQITPAPLGLARSTDQPVLQWLPSPKGYAQSHAALREGLGLLLGF